jgi:hypothetical protein
MEKISPVDELGKKTSFVKICLPIFQLSSQLPSGLSKVKR